MEKKWNNFKRVIKNMNRTIRYIHSKTSYLYTYLFFDIIICYIVYGITYNEYRIFEFYDVNASKRKTYMSKRKYKKLLRRLVDDHIVNVISDKKLFLLRFKDYFKRDIMNVNDFSFKEFELFALKHKNIIARSLTKSFLNSYKRYDIKDFRGPAFILEDINDSKLSLVEKEINQHKDLNDINDFVILNIVSVFNGSGVDIVSSSIKFNEGKHTISGYVNVRKGSIVGHLKDELGHNYKENFNGFVIPNFDDAILLAEKLAHEIEEINQVEWSFFIGKNTVYLLDANVWTDYVFSQIPEFLNNRTGLMSYYKKYL